MPAEFVHLHNHSDFSLLDGAQQVSTLVDTVADLGMDAVGLTEHGNLFSVIPFYQATRAAGIKPILGCEIYVARGSRFDKQTTPGGGWGYNHLLLLVQNYDGYRNLMKLVTLGYLEGFYYRPRVDKDLLRQYNDGLICTSACLKGEVQEKALGGDWERARQAALDYSQIFPGRFYLEIQNHGIEEEASNVANMHKLSQELDLPLVVTNDVHYARRDHWQAHDVHICLGTGKDRADPNRLRYATAEFYFKSQDAMWKQFHQFPGALENTRKIAEEIDFSLPLGEYHLPTFPIPPGAGTGNPDQYLAQLAEEGLRHLYPEVTPDLQKRLDHELGVIKRMGLAGYFLITMDFVRYARENKIPVGPGRGSAAGSLVSYALGITRIDPIKHHLLFERFLNPERVSLPDIDIDFCNERRGEVIDYIKQQYGEDSVSQIITFGTMKARQVVRDVGRVMGYSFGEVDRLAKAIPDELNITLETALQQSPALKEMSQGQYRELMEHSLILEGLHRHASTHAAGVVIAPGDLTDYVPLYKSSKGEVTTQYDMKGLETLGLLKMDFLGLRNLTVIDQTVKLLAERGHQVEIETIPLDDPQVYQLFARGLTTGVFQFESAGMREFLKKLQPTQIEDLIAMNALYRPGPMEHINEFIARKQGRKKITYPHPDLEPILEETYGIIVYQEQVMQIAHEIAGFSLAEADIMRRAMGKKNKDLMAQQKVQFVKGAVDRKLPRRVAQEIYALIEKFAQYGFNKSHSTAYAYIAYRTAWLKTHYPAEFLAANLTSEMGNIDKVVILINEARKLGLRVDPPDVNVSGIHFRPVDDKIVSFGLNAIKNVGTKALEEILRVREGEGPFKTLFEFCAAVDSRAVNRKVLESLITAGAMDSLEGSRAQKFKVIDSALKYGQQVQENRQRQQVALFGSGDADYGGMVPTLPSEEPWPENLRLEREKEVLGMYVSGHPLLKYAEDLEEFSNFDFSERVSASRSKTVRIGGRVYEVKIHRDKKNHEMAFFRLDCLGGQAEVLAFSDTYTRYRDRIREDQIVFVSGRPTDKADFSDLKLIADEIVPLEEARRRFSKRVNIRVAPGSMAPEEVDTLFELAREYRGSCGLLFHLTTSEGKEQRLFAHNVKVSARGEFLQKLRATYGRKNVWVE